MRPRDGRRRHGLNDNDTRQKKTDEFVNFSILNYILNTINLNDKTTSINLSHKENF